MWDISKKVFSPILRELVEPSQVIVVVISQASWDISNQNGLTHHVKAPMSQSAAIVVMNISDNHIKICDAGVRFKNGKELKLTDFSLPIKIEERDRHIFELRPETFKMLNDYGLEKIEYFSTWSPHSSEDLRPDYQKRT